MSRKDLRGRKSKYWPKVYLTGIANEAGISTSYLVRILRGSRTPGWDVAVRLAKALKVELGQLEGELEKYRVMGQVKGQGQKLKGKGVRVA